jgi:hypothetical protein
MNKRGRITLEPRDDIETGQEHEPAENATETQAGYGDDFTAWSETAAEPSAPAASRAPYAGKAVKIAIVGLAAAAAFLWWKSRRP